MLAPRPLTRLASVLKRCALPSVALSPFVILIVAVARYGVDVQSVDSLAYVPLMEKIYVKHLFDVRDFMIPTMAHIAVLPIMLRFLIAPFTHWSAMFELLLQIVVIGLNLALTHMLFVRTMPEATKKERWLFTLAGAALLCGLSQEEIWLMPYGLVFLVSQMTATAAVLALSMTPKHVRNIALAALCCAISSFSFSQGIFSWIVTLPLVAAIDKKRRSRFRFPLTALWLALFGLTLIGEHAAFKEVVILRSDFLYPLNHEWATVRYLLTLVGASVWQDRANPNLVTALGAFFCAALAFAGYKALHCDPNRRERMLPWLSIGFFGFIACLLIALGRAHLGFFPFVSRYMAESIYIPLSLLGLAWIAVRKHPRVLVTLAVGMVVVQLCTDVLSLPAMQHRFILQAQGKACAETYALASKTCMSKLYPWKIPFYDYATTMTARLDAIGFLETKTLPRGVTFETPPGVIGQEKSALPVGFRWDMLVESGAIAVSGWALGNPWETAPDVWLTYGPDRTLFAHTAALIPSSVAQGLVPRKQRLGWSVEVVPPFVNVGSVKIDAWTWDQKKSALLKLDGTLTLQTSPK